jgi:histidine triad (HIT) family protein
MPQEDCRFCQIQSGEAHGDIVYQDDRVTAFNDINPVAPVHILIIPNQHISSVNDLGPEHEVLAGHMLLTASRLADEEGIADSGYRLIINTGSHGGQVIYHLHMHLIGGHRMRHPMG